MSDYELAAEFLAGTPVLEPIRFGFGRGLVSAGRGDPRVLALSADLTESTQMDAFKREFPGRFIEVGVAEQNLVTVAAGLAHAGYVPFASSYAAFSPGRNWEQIKTTAALNDLPVKVVGSHTGLNVGPDGATHQMLEDIALMRVLPNMVVIAPGDSLEAERATLALAGDSRPGYIRLARDATPVLSTRGSSFEIGRGYRLLGGHHVTVAATGTMTAEVLRAADVLAGVGIDVDVLHFPTIKPFDDQLLHESASRTRLVVTVEEAQVAGGFGSLVTESLSERLPTRVIRLGVRDRFGESGKPRELLERFGLTAEHIADAVSRTFSRYAREDALDDHNRSTEGIAL